MPKWMKHWPKHHKICKRMIVPTRVVVVVVVEVVVVVVVVAVVAQ